jgi:hypothetical protein
MGFDNKGRELPSSDIYKKVQNSSTSFVGETRDGGRVVFTVTPRELRSRKPGQELSLAGIQAFQYARKMIHLKGIAGAMEGGQIGDADGYEQAAWVLGRSAFYAKGLEGLESSGFYHDQFAGVHPNDAMQILAQQRQENKSPDSTLSKDVSARKPVLPANNMFEGAAGLASAGGLIALTANTGEQWGRVLSRVWVGTSLITLTVSACAPAFAPVAGVPKEAGLPADIQPEATGTAIAKAYEAVPSEGYIVEFKTEAEVLAVFPEINQLRDLYKQNTEAKGEFGEVDISIIAIQATPDGSSNLNEAILYPFFQVANAQGEGFLAYVGFFENENNGQTHLAAASLEWIDGVDGNAALAVLVDPTTGKNLVDPFIVFQFAMTREKLGALDQSEWENVQANFVILNELIRSEDFTPFQDLLIKNQVEKPQEILALEAIGLDVKDWTAEGTGTVFSGDNPIGQVTTEVSETGEPSYTLIATTKDGEEFKANLEDVVKEEGIDPWVLAKNDSGNFDIIEFRNNEVASLGFEFYNYGLLAEYSDVSNIPQASSLTQANTFVRAVVDSKGDYYVNDREDWTTFGAEREAHVSKNPLLTIGLNTGELDVNGNTSIEAVFVYRLERDGVEYLVTSFLAKLTTNPVIINAAIAFKEGGGEWIYSGQLKEFKNIENDPHLHGVWIGSGFREPREGDAVFPFNRIFYLLLPSQQEKIDEIVARWHENRIMPAEMEEVLWGLDGAVQNP